MRAPTRCGDSASGPRTSRRAGDLLARYGGEEFALILPDVDAGRMQGVAGELLRAVSGTAESGRSDADRVMVTVSVGAISLTPSREGTATASLAVADDLLYEAKAGGRDRGVLLDGSTQQETVVRRLA